MKMLNAGRNNENTSFNITINNYVRYFPIVRSEYIKNMVNFLTITSIKIENS